MCGNTCCQPRKLIWDLVSRVFTGSQPHRRVAPAGLTSATQTPASQMSAWYSVTQSLRHTVQMFTTSHIVNIKYLVWSKSSGIQIHSYQAGYSKGSEVISQELSQGHIPKTPEYAGCEQPRPTGQLALFCTAPCHCFGHLIQLNFPYYLSFSISPDLAFNFQVCAYTWELFLPSPQL